MARLPLLSFVPIHVWWHHPTGGEIGETAVDAVPEALQAVCFGWGHARPPYTLVNSSPTATEPNNAGDWFVLTSRPHAEYSLGVHAQAAGLKFVPTASQLEDRWHLSNGFGNYPSALR